MTNAKQIPCGILERELAHAPGLVLRFGEVAFGRECERGKFLIERVCVRHAPVTARAISRGRKIGLLLEMDDEVSPSQNLVAVIVVTSPETQRLIERARAADILGGEDGFRSFSCHCCCLSSALSIEIQPGGRSIVARTA